MSQDGFFGGRFSVGDHLFVAEHGNTEGGAHEQFVGIIATEGKTDFVHGARGFHESFMLEFCIGERTVILVVSTRDSVNQGIV